MHCFYGRCAGAYRQSRCPVLFSSAEHDDEVSSQEVDALSDEALPKRTCEYKTTLARKKRLLTCSRTLQAEARAGC